MAGQNSAHLPPVHAMCQHPHARKIPLSSIHALPPIHPCAQATYAPFRKNFYIEVPEISRMTEEEVRLPSAATLASLALLSVPACTLLPDCAHTSLPMLMPSPSIHPPTPPLCTMHPPQYLRSKLCARSWMA